MRKEFTIQMCALFEKSPFIFLTGDLGFKAFETLRDVMKNKFINTGIAEQNMISVGAGLCSRGFRVFVYSIAPFCYARPFEQIRNDVCHHALPLTLVGNGGGYGYGGQGPSHHALEDYGVLTTLQNMKAYIPAFAKDLNVIVQHIIDRPLPSYLRLGRCEIPANFQPPEYAPWRQLLKGDAGIVICVGPLAGSLLGDFIKMKPLERPDLWALCELPIPDIPKQIIEDIAIGKRLLVAEEHVSRGSAGEMLAYMCMKIGLTPAAFFHHHAQGYPSKLYGSQNFHRAESRLDAVDIMKTLSQGQTKK